MIGYRLSFIILLATTSSTLPFTPVRLPLSSAAMRSARHEYEAWNSANNPAHVDNSFVYSITSLPLKGQAKATPWPGDYWATARDSINYRWDGASSMSPAEKVAKAFNLQNFPRDITQTVGIYGQSRPKCDRESECASLNDGSSCVTPRGGIGSKVGRCIPSLWGIGHGWAPAAIAEPVPVNAVQRNGVTFYPGDLEALAAYIYSANLPTKVMSERCNKIDKDLDTDTDINGRVRDSACRDMNPGSLFVVVANMLGLRGQGIVEDRVDAADVFNHPVRSYEVTNAVNGKLKEIARTEASALVGLNVNLASLLGNTTLNKGEEKTGVYTATAGGEITFKMSGTGDADLYARKGTEVNRSLADCKSDGGGSSEECRLSVAAGAKVSWLVLGYGESSTVNLAVGTAIGTPNYIYNPAAARFFHVRLALHYVTDSSPARVSHIDQVDSYTRTDWLEFILETDQTGKVLGGEWLGGNRRSHPDFMWWPSATPQSQGLHGLTYPMVKALLEQAKATNR